MAQYAIPVARAIYCDRNHNFLIGKRGDTHKWEFPGGKIEAGESAVDAARRECWEETGLLLSGFTEFAGMTNVKHLTKSRYSIELYFAFAEANGDLSLGMDGHLEWSHCSLPQLQLWSKNGWLMPSAKECVEKLLPDFLKRNKDWPPVLVNVEATS